MTRSCAPPTCPRSDGEAARPHAPRRLRQTRNSSTGPAAEAVRRGMVLLALFAPPMCGGLPCAHEALQSSRQLNCKIAARTVKSRVQTGTLDAIGDGSCETPSSKDSPRNEGKPARRCSSMHVRCPHCQNAIEIVGHSDFN